MLPPADNRITKYERAGLALTFAVSTVVTAAVIVADRIQVNLLVDLMPEHSGTMAMCNAKLGARVLFWTSFVCEFATIALVSQLKFPAPDIATYQARMKPVISGKEEQKRGSIPFKVAASTLFFAIVTYWASFHLAYGDSKICHAQFPIQTAVSYFYLFGVSAARGLLLFFFCHLYFMSLKTDVAECSRPIE